MKHKVGDKVRIKSIDWYNENKDLYGGFLVNGTPFVPLMSEYCGKEATITAIVIRDKVEFKINIDKGKFLYDEGMFEDIPENDSTSDTFQNIADTIRKIAEIIRKDNIGLSVKEQDGGILILPCNKEEEGDLPIDTPVMASSDSIDWHLRYYSGKYTAFANGHKSNDNIHTISWVYIIPFSQFDINNIEESLKHNIVPKKLKQ